MGPSPPLDGLPAVPHLVILGADGLVGSALVELLQQRSFPAGRITAIPFSELGRSAASALSRVRSMTEKVDFAFLATRPEQSRAVAKPLLKLGAWVLDFSNAFRLDPQVPLAVMGMEGLPDDHEHRLLALPNCTNPALFPVLQALHHAGDGLQRVRVHTAQAASGGGRRLLASLEASPAKESPEPGLLGNVWPQIGALDAHGRSAEEAAIVDEAKRSLQLPDLDIAASCLRVPVAVGHGMTVEVQTAKALSPQQAQEALAGVPHLELHTEVPPMPSHVNHRDAAHVGRIRLVDGQRAQAGLMLWLVADNLYQGAATHALRVAETLLPD